MDLKSISMNCKRTEFVGTAVLDTIGLVISGINEDLLKTMNIGTRYRALGLFSSRTGAAGQHEPKHHEHCDGEAKDSACHVEFLLVLFISTRRASIPEECRNEKPGFFRRFS